MSSIWYNFQISEEQRQRIEAGEREAFDQFYFDNLDYLRKLGLNFIYSMQPSRRHFYNIDDMLQDVYASFPKYLKFSKCSHFCVSLKHVFYHSACGGIINSHLYNMFKLYDDVREAFYNTWFLDECISSMDKPLIYFIPDSTDPHTVLVRELERRRQDRIEAEADEILQRVLSSRNYDLWIKNYTDICLDLQIRKHASEILDVLRKNGTPESKLKGKILTCAEQKQLNKHKREIRLVREAWEEAHIAELPHHLKLKVKKRIEQRKYYQKKKERASV